MGLLLMLLLLMLLTPPLSQPWTAALTVQVVDQEDEIEHQVTYARAVEQARQIRLYPGPVPGCKPCTSAEMRYCRDGSVLEDHCCCDNSYNEVLSFVEHTCRVSSEACQVRAGNCAEYTRLRECCCHSHLASLWKYLAGAAGAHCGPSRWLLAALLLAWLLLKAIT